MHRLDIPLIPRLYQEANHILFFALLFIQLRKGKNGIVIAEINCLLIALDGFLILSLFLVPLSLLEVSARLIRHSFSVFLIEGQIDKANPK